MGLVYWLPLINDVHNQGLEDVDITYTNLTWVNGKIGTAPKWSLSTSDTLYLRGAASRMCNMQYYSMCAWVKVVDSFSGHSQAIISSGNWNQADTLINFAIKKNGSSVKMLITASRGWDTGVDITDYFTFDEWHHVCMTWDGDKTNAYVDGVLCGSIQYGGMPSTYDVADVLIGGATYTTPTFRFNGLMNDIRIYDHCLSPLEVKEISKGLVLHYPLSMPGQENLQQGSDCIGSENVPGWVNNGNTTLEKIGDVIHFKRTLSNAKSVPTITMNCVTPCEFNKSYVYSMDLKFDRDIITATAAPAHFWFGARNTDNIFNTKCKGNLSKKSSTVLSPPASTIIPANTWFTQKHCFTFGDGPTSEGYDYPAIRCFVYGSVLTENYTGEVNGWMKNCKIEEGEIATPWLPNPADAAYTALGFNDGIEYDVSGYRHNGTKYGTLTYSSDTPRYNTSTVFNGTDNCIKFPFNDFCTNGDIFTMNIWWKKTELGSKNYETLIGGPSGFEMDTRSGSAQTLSLYMASTRGGNVYPSFNMGEWYMITLVNDGTNELYYVNGVLVKTIEKKNMPTGNYYVGAWQTEAKQNFQGNMSDFKIYKTALSAEDVYNLYAVGASLSDTGVLFSNEVSEV